MHSQYIREVHSTGLYNCNTIVGKGILFLSSSHHLHFSALPTPPPPLVSEHTITLYVRLAGRGVDSLPGNFNIQSSCAGCASCLIHLFIKSLTQRQHTYRDSILLYSSQLRDTDKSFCTVVNVTGTLVEDKMRTLKG